MEAAHDLGVSSGLPRPPAPGRIGLILRHSGRIEGVSSERRECDRATWPGGLDAGMVVGIGIVIAYSMSLHVRLGTVVGR